MTTPTTRDTIENRMKEFMRCAIGEFIVRANYEISCANDKNNVKVNGFSKYFGKTAEYGTIAPVYASTGALLPYALAGKIAVDAVNAGIDMHEKYAQSGGHKCAKKIQHLLAGFSAVEESWMSTLADVFIEIFINFNAPFFILLQNPVDAWTKVMLKLAQDAVHRMFDYFKDKSVNEKEITKQLLLQAFLQGNSYRGTWKKVTNQKPGREIKVEAEPIMTIMTSEVFEKSLQIMLKNDQYKAKVEPTVETLVFKFRHLFEFEEKQLSRGQNELVDVIKSETLKKDDQKTYLIKIKETVLREITDKFNSKEKEILKYVKKSEKHFEELVNNQENIEGKIDAMQSDFDVLKVDTTKILDKVHSIERSQNKEIITIIIGNPGRGKSTILNNLAGEPLFESGPSPGEGLTKDFEKRQNKKGETFIDTPGFSDRNLKPTAAKAILKGLRQSGNIKVIFVICLEEDIVDEEDILTMKLALAAAPDIGKSYGIIVNMVSENILEELKGKPQFFLDKALKEISERNRCLDNRVLFLGEIPELDDQFNILLSPNDPKSLELYSFFENEVPIVNIKPENVRDINLEN